MIYGLAADLILLIHLLFVAAVVGGGVAWLWWRWAPLVHLPMAAWGGAVELGGRLCPLTVWENALLQAAGEAGYEGGFVGHYLLGVLYPEGLTRDIQVALGVGVLAVNAVVYTWIWWRRSSRLRPGAGR